MFTYRRSVQHLSLSRWFTVPQRLNHQLTLRDQVRRQLEYSIAASKGVRFAKPPNTVEAIRDIFRTNGLLGLYTGFRLHFGASFPPSDAGFG